MGGQSGGSQTVTNRTEIDPVTQAWRQNIINAGGALYNQGTPDYYPNSTVVPFSNQTQAGLDYLQNHAMQGAQGYGAALGASDRALSGFNPGMPFAANAAMGGLNNQNLGGLQQFGSANNPFLRGLFDQGAQQVGDAVNAQFAQAGRFSSGAHQGVMQRGMNDLYNSIYAPAYEQERNRGLQAAGQLAGYGDANANRQLQGADLMSGIWSQGNADAARQQALLPGLFSYGQMPGQALLDIGGMYEGQAGQYLDDDRARYDYAANGAWDQLARYSQIVSGMPDFSGSSQTSPRQGPNRTMSAMGGAASGAAMGTQIMPGWGTAIGAVLGAGAGYFSDRRLKRDAKPIGRDSKGHRWWSFRYLWDAIGTVRLGVMADEIEHTAPHAIALDASGFARVNYGAL